MIYLLAQTTQQSSGMSGWSPADWGIFFLAAGGFVTTIATIALIPLIVAYYKGKTALKIAEQQQQQIAEQDKKIQTVAMAASPSIPNTPEIERKVNEIATGTGDGTIK